MKNAEIIKSSQEQANFIYKMFAEIRIKSEKMVKDLSEMCYIATHKHDKLGVNLKLAEEQIFFQLKEANECHQKIDQNLKKLAELIEASDTLPSTPHNKDTPEENTSFEDLMFF